MYKVIVFVNIEDKEIVKEAMFAAGAGRIGNYDLCCFETEGLGQFRPLAGSNPTIGRENNIEKVREVRIETVVSDEKITNVLRAMLSAHPYEEPAYDVFKHVSIDL
ncbi:MAG: NGG1p interacting factor NIF3 [Bacteriovoracaceae bacterium]|nr:NGG1p interacting factor NIF3 [Bacteriovoracaceae bacterium]